MIVPADTISYDTLVYDASGIAIWQSVPDYDYNRELVTPEMDVFKWLSMWLGRLLDKVFGNKFAEEYSELILIVLFVLLLLLIVWFVYKKRPELFMRSGRRQAYLAEEDTIYGVDFMKEIDDACNRKDYYEAIRLLYLQTLRSLSDAEQINWQPYKTPTEYIYELKREEQKIPFQNLTLRFLRIRYGNFEATEELFREATDWQKQIMKGETV